MKVRFSFRCPSCDVQVKCSLGAIQVEKPCPGCSKSILVPTPSDQSIADAIPDVPFPIPGRSMEDYQSLAAEIVQVANFSCALWSRCEKPERCVPKLCDAISSLESLRVFVIHCLEEETAERSEAAVPMLQNLAAGNDFAGVGNAELAEL